MSPEEYLAWSAEVKVRSTTDALARAVNGDKQFFTAEELVEPSGMSLKKINAAISRMISADFVRVAETQDGEPKRYLRNWMFTRDRECAVRKSS